MICLCYIIGVIVLYTLCYIAITPLPTYLPRYLLHMKAGPTLPTSGDSNCFGSDPKLSKFFRSEALHRSSCVDPARCFQEILFTVLIGLDISKTLPRCNLQTYIEEPVFSCTFQEILFKQTGAAVNRFHCWEEGQPNSRPHCTVFTCAGCMRCFFKNVKTIHRMTVCLKFFEEHQIFRNTPHVKSIGYSTMAVFYTLFSIVLTFMNQIFR